LLWRLPAAYSAPARIAEARFVLSSVLDERLVCRYDQVKVLMSTYAGEFKADAG
jgi:hypothetical protein